MKKEPTEKRARVVFLESLGRWVVGLGRAWPGRRMTLRDARRIAKKRNAKGGTRLTTGKIDGGLQACNPGQEKRKCETL